MVDYVYVYKVYNPSSNENSLEISEIVPRYLERSDRLNPWDCVGKIKIEELDGTEIDY